MAKSNKKKSKRAKANRFGIVMTDRIRLFLAACAAMSFVVVVIIALWK
jgi:uncharacterized membrane protein YqjE